MDGWMEGRTYGLDWFGWLDGFMDRYLYLNTAFYQIVIQEMDGWMMAGWMDVFIPQCFMSIKNLNKCICIT